MDGFPCVSASLLGFCLGSTVGWTSPMQPLLTSEFPPVGSEPMTTEAVAWLGSINFMGTIIGTLFWGVAADRWGRKTTSSLVAIPYIVSWTLIYTATNIESLLVARIIGGIGNSGAIVNVPVFITEIAQDDLRGFFGSFFGLAINAGVLFGYTVGTYLQYHGLALSCMMVPIFFLATFIWLPETPMFLWKKGRTDEAERSLMWYKGGDLLETENVLSKYKTMTSSQSMKKPSLKTLVSTRGTVKAMVIGVGLMVAVQGSGIFPILNFAVSIFEMCGTSLSPHHSAIILGSTQLAFGFLCSLVVDRLGRKSLLMSSLVTMTFSLGLLGTYLFFFGDQPAHPVLSWIPIICLSMHVVFFSLGLGAVCYVIVGEIFPPEIRGLAMSTLAFVTGVLAFTIIKLFPTMRRVMKPYGIFFFYSSCCLFFAFFFYFNLPETKGKPQNVILKILNGEELTDEENAEETQRLHDVKHPNIVKKGIV